MKSKRQHELNLCSHKSFLKKGKSAIHLPPLSNGLKVLSSASDKAKLLKTFLGNLTLKIQVISLPAFLSRINRKLRNISVTPKLVKKVITNLDLPKASCPGYIPMVVLNNYEPELWYILAESFNMGMKQSCFSDCWKASVVLVFKNVGERSTAENYHAGSLLSVVRKAC